MKKLSNRSLLLNSVLLSLITFIFMSSIATFGLSEQTAFASTLDYTWVDNEDGTATITKYDGSDTDVKIPRELDGLIVTHIGEYAFSSKQLTEIIIPDSVLSIGDYAFYDNQLTSVTTPDSVTSIGEGAFNTNKLNEVTISDSVTTIGDYVFWGNLLLTKVTILNKTTFIANDAFIANGAFGYILTIFGYDPSTAKDFANVKGYTFRNIKGDYKWVDNGNGTATITKFNGSGDVEIPRELDGLIVTHIGDYAFYDNQLTSVTIPDSVTSISEGAFYFNNLTQVTILNKTTWISDDAFDPDPLIIFGYEPSTAKDYADHNGHTFRNIKGDYEWVDNGNGTATITKYNGSDTDVEIPRELDGLIVTHIGEDAFLNKQLTEIIIPDSVLSIGDYAFSDNQLTSVTIPDSVTSIGQGVFYLNNLTQVTIPDSVTTIGNWAFFGSNLLTIFGYEPSTAKDYADHNGHTFHSIKKITYDDNGSSGGSVPTDNKGYKEEDTVTVLGNTGQLGNTGYTFVGWNTANDGSGTSYLAGHTFKFGSDDIILYAQWEMNQYTVSFESNGGSSTASITADYDTQIAKPNSPTRTGYTFGGWYTDEVLTHAYDFDATVMENTTLYAKWTVVIGYTVSFNIGGGTAVTEQTVVHGSLAQEPTHPTKSGYVFGGWYTDNTHSTIFNFLKMEITSNTTIYAKWDSYNPPSSPVPPSIVHQPATQTRVAHIFSGNDDDKQNMVKTEITRKTQSGKVIDEVSFNESEADEIIDQVLSNHSATVRIIVDDIADQLADEVKVNVAKETVDKLNQAGLSLTLEVGGVIITLPHSTLERLGNNGEDLYFHIIPIRPSADRKTVEERILNLDELKDYAKGQVVGMIGQPVMIDTNYTSQKTLIQFPLAGFHLPTDPFERDLFLDGLTMFIEHSDGENVIKHGKVIYDANGNPTGIEIEIEKFSTFTLLHIDKEVIDFPSYINGYPNKTFGPSEKITRAELATMLARNVNEKVETGTMPPYPDVATKHWAYHGIQQAKAQGLMVGDGKGLFRPEDTVSRAEMAVVTARWNQLQKTKTIAFEDVTGHWAAGFIGAAKAAGILDGYTDGTFRPNQAVTRAESVKMLNIAFGRPALEDVNLSSWSDVPVNHWAISHIESASKPFQAFNTFDGTFKFKKPSSF